MDRTELQMLIINSLVHVRLCLEDHILNLHDLKRTILWGVTTYSPVEVYGRFGGNDCLHLHCRNVSQARSRLQAKCTRFLFYI
jgi:hypothetical protein